MSESFLVLYYTFILISFLYVVFSILFFIFNKFKKSKYNRNYYPSVSIVIPAYNEQDNISESLDRLISNPYRNFADFEIIVVDDGSTDRTSEIVREYSKKFSFIRLAEKKQNEKRAAALNYGIKQSVHEIIICLDADTVLKEDSIFNIVIPFQSKDVKAVAAHIEVKLGRSVLELFQYLEYKFTMSIEKRLQNSLNFITCVSGAFGAFHRSLFNEVMFDKDSLAEDTDLTFAIKQRGYKIEYAPDAIAVTKAPNTLKNLYKQRVRWLLGLFQVFLKYKNVLLCFNKCNRSFFFSFWYMLTFGFVYNYIFSNVLLISFFYFMFHLPLQKFLFLVFIVISIDITVFSILGKEMNKKRFGLIDISRKLFFYIFNNFVLVSALYRLKKKQFHW